MNLRPYKPFLFLLILLIIGIGGSGCRFMRVHHRAGENEGEGSGGGVAKSETYSLNRARMGVPWTMLTSENGTYTANASLANSLHQLEMISDRYTITHPLTKKVLEMPQELQVQWDQVLLEHQSLKDR